MCINKKGALDFGYGRRNQGGRGAFTSLDFGRIQSKIFAIKRRYIIDSGAPVAFKTLWGHQHMVGLICLPLVGIQ